jgi:hypothetical protein
MYRCIDVKMYRCKADVSSSIYVMSAAAYYSYISSEERERDERES